MIVSTYSFDACEYPKDSNGFIRVPARVMKVGVLNYRDPKGIPYAGYISKEELLKASKDAGMKPISNRHPLDMITPDDYKKHNVGTSAENFRLEDKDGEQWLVGDFVINNKEEIDLVEKAKKEGRKIHVSAGYLKDPVRTGNNTFDFKNIRINHFALLPNEEPRAKGASIDSQDGDFEAVEIGETPPKPKHEVKNVIKRTLPKITVGEFTTDSLDIEYDEKTETAVDKLVARGEKLVSRIENLESKAVALKESKDSAEGKVLALETNIEKLEKAQADTVSKDSVKKIAKELSAVETRLKTIGVEKEIDSVEEGKRLFVETVTNKSTDSMSDAMVDGAYFALSDEKDNQARVKASTKKAEAENQSNDSAQKTTASPSVFGMTGDDLKSQIMNGGK